MYVSPMARCLQTAAILYPDIQPEVVPDFRECDFGDFKGLGYAELNGRADYQAWVDSGGELPFPHGESKATFSARGVRAYERLARHEDCALIVHGGTIMAIMERYARPKADYYHFQVRNGEGYLLSPNGAYTRLASAETPENRIDAMPRSGYNELDK